MGVSFKTRLQGVVDVEVDVGVDVSVFVCSVRYEQIKMWVNSDSRCPGRFV